MHVAHGWSRSQTSPLKGRTYCIQTENSKHNKRDNLMIEWVFSDWHGLCFKLKKLNSHLVTKKNSFDYQVVSSVLLPISCVECSVSAPYVPWTRSCPFKQNFYFSFRAIHDPSSKKCSMAFEFSLGCFLFVISCLSMIQIVKQFYQSLGYMFCCIRHMILYCILRYQNCLLSEKMS